MQHKIISHTGYHKRVSENQYHCRLNSASLEQVYDYSFLIFFPWTAILLFWFLWCNVISQMSYFCSYCTDMFSNSLGILLVLYDLCPSKVKHSYLPFSLSLGKIWLPLLLPEIQICLEWHYFRIATHMCKLSEGSRLCLIKQDPA